MRRVLFFSPKPFKKRKSTTVFRKPWISEPEEATRHCAKLKLNRIRTKLTVVVSGKSSLQGDVTSGTQQVLKLMFAFFFPFNLK